jgi:hypothetical protein
LDPGECGKPGLRKEASGRVGISQKTQGAIYFCEECLSKPPVRSKNELDVRKIYRDVRQYAKKGTERRKLCYDMKHSCFYAARSLLIRRMHRVNRALLSRKRQR